MSDVRWAGRYRDLPYGQPDEPSLQDAAPLDDAVKSAVVAHLRAAPVLAASGTLSTDVVTGEPIGPLHVHTDAVWVWYSDLPHYVERYDSPLPDALVSHAATAAPPELSVEQLMEVAKVIRETP